MRRAVHVPSEGGGAGPISMIDSHQLNVLLAKLMSRSRPFSSPPGDFINLIEVSFQTLVRAGWPTDAARRSAEGKQVVCFNSNRFGSLETCLYTLFDILTVMVREWSCFLVNMLGWIVMLQQIGKCVVCITYLLEQ